MRAAPSRTDVDAVARACREILAAAGGVTLDDDYFYASLPLCVIDAVFSIGVKYGSVRNVVERYCRRFGLPKLAPTGPPPQAGQESISSFFGRFRGIDAAMLASDVFENRQRTSSRTS